MPAEDEKRFNGNAYFLACLVTLDMNLMELLLDVSQNRPLKILLAAVGALETRHVIDHKKFVVVPINVLCLCRVEVFMATENTMGMHHAPRSYGFLNFGGVGI